MSAAPDFPSADTVLHILFRSEGESNDADTPHL
jgi:hypothetical protein